MAGILRLIHGNRKWGLALKAIRLRMQDRPIATDWYYAINAGGEGNCPVGQCLGCICPRGNILHSMDQIFNV